MKIASSIFDSRSSIQSFVSIATGKRLRSKVKRIPEQGATTEFSLCHLYFGLHGKTKRRPSLAPIGSQLLTLDG